MRMLLTAALGGFVAGALAVAAPDRTTGAVDWIYPVIADYGEVVRLPEAAEQPRSGTKLIVDLTAGGDPAEVNPGLAKVARYLNIYGGAGAAPASCRIAVVAHGQAVPVVLNDEAYLAATGVARNPNVELIRKLRAAGVELFVCGQALTHQGHRADEVMREFSLAVSALTVNVNRQAEGFIRVPLH